MRTSPVQTPEAGFTLLEVLVALAVAVVLLGAVASSLIASLRAEDYTRYLEETPALISRLQCLEALGLEPDPVVEETENTWFVNGTFTTLDDDSLWRLWELSPRARPSLTVSFAIHKEELEGSGAR